MGRLPTATYTKSRTCKICQSPERAEIEQLVLSMSASNPTLTLDAIADAYDISSTELRVHALMHTPLALDFSQESEVSLVESFKRKAGYTFQSDAEGEAEFASSQPLTSDASGSDISCATQSASITGATQPSSVAPVASTAPTAPTSGQRKRMTDEINLREGDMLLASANEMLTTLTTLGRKIKRFASDNDEGADQRLVNFCTPSLVNLYVQSSSELRKTVDAITSMNVAVNGAHDSAADGLTALANAIRNSVNSAQPSGDAFETAQQSDD